MLPLLGTLATSALSSGVSTGVSQLMGGSQATAPKQTEGAMPQEGSKVIQAQNQNSVEQGEINV